MGWKQIEGHGTPPAPREGHGTATIASNGPEGDYMYIFGGRSHEGNRDLNDMYRLATRTQKWEKVSTGLRGPSARVSMTLTPIPPMNRFVMFGGSGTGVSGDPTFYNDVWVFDTTTNDWQKVKTRGTLPEGREYHSASYCKGQLIIFGGNGAKNRVFKDLWVLDLDRWTWSQPECSGSGSLEFGGALPGPRSGHTSCVLANKFLVFIGGHNGKELVSDVRVLDIDRWHYNKPPVKGPTPRRWGHTCIALNKGDIFRLLVFGGYDGNYTTQDMWVLDTSTMTWYEPPRSTAIPISARFTHSATVCNGFDMYVFGGFQGDVNRGKGKCCNDLHVFYGSKILHDLDLTPEEKAGEKPSMPSRSANGSDVGVQTAGFGEVADGISAQTFYAEVQALTDFVKHRKVNRYDWGSVEVMPLIRPMRLAEVEILNSDVVDVLTDMLERGRDDHRTFKDKLSRAKGDLGDRSNEALWVKYIDVRDSLRKRAPNIPASEWDSLEGDFRKKEKYRHECLNMYQEGMDNITRILEIYGERKHYVKTATFEVDRAIHTLPDLPVSDGHPSLSSVVEKFRRWKSRVVAECMPTILNTNKKAEALRIALDEERRLVREHEALFAEGSSILGGFIAIAQDFLQDLSGDKLETEIGAMEELRRKYQERIDELLRDMAIRAKAEECKQMYREFAKQKRKLTKKYYETVARIEYYKAAMNHDRDAARKLKKAESDLQRIQDGLTVAEEGLAKETICIEEAGALDPELMDKGNSAILQSIRDTGMVLPLTMADFEIVVDKGKTKVCLSLRENRKMCILKWYDMKSPAEMTEAENQLVLAEELEHPSIKPCEGVFHNKGSLVAKMPFFELGTLKDWINSKNPPPFDIQAVYAQLCACLAHMHDRGYVYARLSIHSVAIADGGSVAMIDLGGAHEADMDDPGLIEDNPNPKTSAPELLDGDGRSCQSDMWDFGVVLYYAAFHHMPELNSGETTVKIPAHPLERLRDLLQHLLVRDARTRYTSHQALMHQFFTRSIVHDLSEQNEVAVRADVAVTEFLPHVRNESKKKRLDVNEKALVDSMMDKFARIKSSELIYRFEYSYNDNSGWQGNSAEIYSQFVKIIFSKRRGSDAMFVSHSAVGFIPNPSYNPTADFETFGKILAKAVIDGCVVPCMFGSSVWKFLLDIPVSLGDLKDFDEGTYREFTRILETPNVEKLVSDPDLNDSNKHEFVRKNTEKILVGVCRKQLEALYKGFHCVPDMASHVKILSVREVREFVCGQTHMTAEAVIDALHFENFKNPEYMNKLLLSLSPNLLRRFMYAVTGMWGFPNVRLHNPTYEAVLRGKITIQGSSNTGSLPTPRAKHYQLVVPEYGNQATLKEKMVSWLERVEDYPGIEPNEPLLTQNRSDRAGGLVGELGQDALASTADDVNPQSNRKKKLLSL